MTMAVTAALALLFLLSGATKVVPTPRSVPVREKLAIPATAWALLGAAEIAGAAGVLVGLSVRPLGIAAAVGLVLVGIGAVVAHGRLKDGLAHAAPAVVALVLAVAALALISTGR
ncbi:MAG: hypothetical protein JWQ32_2713 [Marmoricola sp.]|nr:hypothetical protein [Marmoricola sp.]